MKVTEKQFRENSSDEDWAAEARASLQRVVDMVDALAKQGLRPKAVVNVTVTFDDLETPVPAKKPAKRKAAHD